jgi:Protein of unknown function, DUF547
MTARLTRALLVSCAGALLAACTTPAPAPAAPTLGADAALAAWARVLQRHVDARGEVDFPALAADRADLDAYLRHVAQTPLERVADGPARLAHMINAYNALSMFNVVQSGIPDTHAGFNKVGFFVLRRFEIGGRRLSLRGFENDVIRPYALNAAQQRHEPRIHFALNCSARACPVLPRHPFSAAALDAELERETRAFFARRENFRVDEAAQTVWLSQLLAFYPEDFVPGAAPSLLAYANRYAARPAPPHFSVRFTPYDWTIANSAAQPSAR